MTFWSDLEHFGNTPCVSGAVSLTYFDVARQADEVVAGVTGGLALILCGRNVATMLGYLGCLRNGIVPLMLPDDISKTGVNKLIDRYRPTWAWASRQWLEETLGVGVETGKTGAYEWVRLSDEVVTVAPQLALLLTTSGTTADPKLVRLSARNLQSNASSIADALAIDQHSKPITLLPFNYSFGLSVLNSHLNQGSTIVFSDASISSRDFWSCFKNEDVSSFYGVPYHYEMLKRFRFSRSEYPSLNLMAQAGGRMSESLKQEFFQLGVEKGFKFVPMYGQTEATARISWLPSDYFDQKFSSVGVSIPGGKISIHKPDASGVGEVLYEGPNVSLGYAMSKEDLALGDENKGKLSTGDLGYLDDDGFLFLTGRKKRCVKVFGHNVNLDHLESIVREVVSETAVVGNENKVLVLSAGGCVDVLAELLAERTTIQSSAIAIKIVDSLIYTANGKIDYSELIRRYAE